MEGGTTFHFVADGIESALDEAFAAAALPEPERDPALAAAVATLPPRRRLIVFLHYFADLTYHDIAEACGIAEGTVAASLTQARAALLEALEEEER
jgi:RNA polymerase sigma factor (sigma-70 family)